MKSKKPPVDKETNAAKIRHLLGCIKSADEIKHFDGLNLARLADWDIVNEDNLENQQDSTSVLSGMFEDSSMPQSLVTLGDLKKCSLEGSKIILRVKTAKKAGRYISLHKLVDICVDGNPVITDTWKAFAIDQYISVGETELTHAQLFDLIVDTPSEDLAAVFEDNDIGPLEAFEHECYESLANLVSEAASSGQAFASY
jgi:hypothetical protein